MTFFQKRWRGLTLFYPALKTVRMLQEKSECAGELGRTFGFLFQRGDLPRNRLIRA